jgi:hypothetical protein
LRRSLGPGIYRPYEYVRLVLPGVVPKPESGCESRLALNDSRKLQLFSCKSTRMLSSRGYIDIMMGLVGLNASGVHTSSTSLASPGIGQACGQERSTIINWKWSWESLDPSVLICCIPARPRWIEQDGAGRSTQTEIQPLFHFQTTASGAAGSNTNNSASITSWDQHGWQSRCHQTRRCSK